ncbi:Uncharacterised protein [uncultured archaeon]|nr:Uncharacterised protein [uncultured archaeon]
MADPSPVKIVEEKKPSSLLNLLHIALDTYDDIFSDFDPSGYEHRILSDDFLKEMQKRYVETRKGEFEIRFSVPAVLRSPKTEALIKKRLKDYFQNQLKLLDTEIDKRKKSGAVYFFVGFLVLLVTVYAGDLFPSGHALQIAAILLTPLGWFGMWEGIGQYVQAPMKFEDQKKFYNKFSRANYMFMNEEDFVKELAAMEAEEVAKAEPQKKQ